MNQRVVNRFLNFSLALSILVTALGVLVLLGWVFNNEYLKSVLPHWNSMKANTAICFSLSGVSLFLLRLPVSKTRFFFARLCACLVLLLALLTFSQYVFGWDLHIDQLFFVDSHKGMVIPGRMAPQTALVFICLSLALLTLDLETKNGFYLAQYLCLVGGAIALLSCIGYLYGIKNLYALSAYTSMAFHTSCGVLALSMGIALSRPARGIVKVLSRDNLGGVLARRFFPLSILLPLLVGWLRMLGEDTGLYDARFGLALFVTVMIVVFILFIIVAARWLMEANAKIQDGVEMVKKIQEERTQVVQQNNEYLKQANQNYEKQNTIMLSLLEDLNDSRNVLRDKSQALMESNTELEQFAYIASHDLQEPLRMVASFTELLAKKYQDRLDQQAMEYIHYAVDGAKRMQQLIHALLEYSRVGRKSQEFKSVDFQDIYNKTLLNLQVAIQESGAVITHSALPMVKGDMVQLISLLQNLVGNAIKFRGNAIPAIHVSAELKEGRWYFSVKDNGIGIDPQYAERIFVIFQRLHTREEYPGTGIGLAICKKIVEKHGGKISVESAPGQGTTFVFSLATA